eukprot:5502738-Heterocapsa_arctica.AAC.1
MAKGLDVRERGVVSSHIATADATGSSFGMLVGGFAIDHVPWRWIFLLPASLMTAAWLCSLRILPSNAVPFSSFDWPGTVLFDSASFCALFALNRGND